MSTTVHQVGATEASEHGLVRITLRFSGGTLPYVPWYFMRDRPLQPVLRRHGLGGKRLRSRLQRRNWPQQRRLEEPARNGRQDDRRETDHGGKDQQARIADHPILV
jgi:hypothetical protein